MFRSYQKRKSLKVRCNGNVSFTPNIDTYLKYQARPIRKIRINEIIEQNTDKMECSSDYSSDDQTMDRADFNNENDDENENEVSDDDSSAYYENENVEVLVSDDEFVDSENYNEITIENLQSIQDQMLHQYSSFTQREACTLLLAFKRRYRLTNRCFAALLKLIKIFLPFGNNLPTTLESIKRLTGFSSKIDLKKYCPNDECQQIVPGATCVKRICKNFNKPIQPDLFHYVSIKNQLINFIQRYHQDISKYLDGNKSFLDIVETSHYIKANTVDFNMINLIIYTDGIKLNNNDKECWPVFLSICELPLSLRDSKYNKIIAGK